MTLQQIHREHYRSLVRFLYRRIGDRSRAEDLAQESFVRAIEHRPSNQRAWLFAVAANLARDELRRGSVRKRHLSLVKSEWQRKEPDPETALARRERVRDVRAALEELAERDRDALLMWEEGLSYSEIAEALGMSRGSVGTTLSRARSRFAAAFRRLEEGRGDQNVAH